MHAIKLSWGTGIAITYTIFVLVLVFAVVQSTKVDHSLVTEDYYQKDLEYQTQIDKEVNALNLGEDLQIKYADAQKAVQLQFPAELGAVQGKILFFRPSDKNLDFEAPVKADERGQQTISTQTMMPGLWKVQVNWQAGGVAYYKEESIIF
ncbi:MAG: FixH family protein [Saprospirales bacterium]|nr:FixH family protein [Saprospirales bacterium]